MDKQIKTELALYTSAEMFGRDTSALDEADRVAVEASSLRVWTLQVEQAVDMLGEDEVIDFNGVDKALPYLLF